MEVAAESSGISLEQAIKDKYCWQEDQASSPLPASSPGLQAAATSANVNESALGYRPGSSPVQKLSIVVLDRKGVSEVQDVRHLTQLCPRVVELHISFNKITHSRDMNSILSSMPSLKVLDLGHNPLDSSTFVAPNGHFLPNGNSVPLHLSTLVLNGTAISWEALQSCIPALNQLRELHLSINDYTNVNLPEAVVHPDLERLYLNDNKISQWAELAKTSPAFPNLRTLIACNNPIQDVPELPSGVFPSLCTLNLNGSALSSWQSIEHLQALCHLEQLSVLKVPVCEQMEEKEGRMALIARLPRVSKLNKSAVSENEREGAERWFIRDYTDKPDPPAVYHELVQKHGKLCPLAEVDLNPDVTVTLQFHFQLADKKTMEERAVSVDQTLWELKKWVGKNILGMPASSFEMWYCEPPRRSRIRLTQNEKFLYAYRFHEGTKIHIDMKQRRYVYSHSFAPSAKDVPSVSH